MGETQEGWSDEQLGAFERAHGHGVTVQELVRAFGGRLTEATFRKYVQLGLLPRSHRVGRKGKHRGSQGLYPATVARRIETIRRLMGEGRTIEEIQRDALLGRGDLEELERATRKVFASLETAARERNDELLSRKVMEARALSVELSTRLLEIEERLSARVRMARAAV
jgi:hypothetical protein